MKRGCTVKAEFKAHERWINGQIPQITLKEFRSAALRPKEFPQQSQCCVVNMWRWGDLDGLRRRAVQRLRGLHGSLAELLYTPEHEGGGGLMTLMLWLDAETLASSFRLYSRRRWKQKTDTSPSSTEETRTHVINSIKFACLT